MSGAAAEGKAGICSLFVAWPSRITGQYGREAHLTQNNLLADSKPNAISAFTAPQSPGIYQSTVLFSLWVCVELFSGRFFVTNTEVKGQTWLPLIPAGRPNLSLLSPSIDQWHLTLHSETWVSLLHSSLLSVSFTAMQRVKIQTSTF